MNTRPVTVITAHSRRPLLDLRELFEFRDLVYFLVMRDILVRYKQTVLGGLWAIIQPLFSMIVMSIVFGRLAKMPSDGAPYPLFNLTGLVVWSYFANVVAISADSLVSAPSLVTKVYFPRIVLPIVPILSGLLDFTIAFLMLLGMLFVFGSGPTAAWPFLPLLILMLMLTACGTGLFLATLHARYRDIRHTIPYLLQFWLFSSPVIYPSSLIPDSLRPLYALNPIVGVIDGFRSILLGGPGCSWSTLLPSLFSCALIVYLGLHMFRLKERQLADVI